MHKKSVSSKILSDFLSFVFFLNVEIAQMKIVPDNLMLISQTI